MEVGAGTFHPATTLRALGPAPWSAAYVQPSRRPTDGRYGDSPNRWQHYYQFQVIIKPSPPDLQDLYLGSLAAIGIDIGLHDIRFVEDDWESPTLGAWGLGWEVWCDGMEVSQFTYFQQVGGHDCRPVSGELTYGLERLAMYVLGFDDGNLMPFNDPAAPIPLTYGDVFREAEAEYARWNFDVADTAMLLRHFEDAEAECARILAEPDIDPKTGRRIVMALPAYDQCIKASPPLQPARRPRRDLGHRAPGLHRPGPRAGEDVRRRLRPGRRGGMTAPIRALRVHLGAHKTATTHLQKALHQHRAALGAADIDFLRPVELRPALRAAAGWPALPWGAARRLGAAIDGLRSGAGTLAISEENLPGQIRDLFDEVPYRHLGTRLAPLARLAGEAPLALFLAIRPFDPLWPSAHAEALRHYPHDPDRIARLGRIARTRPPSWLDVVARLRRACPAARSASGATRTTRRTGRRSPRRLPRRDTGRIAEVTRPKRSMSPSAEGVRLAEAVGARDRRAAVAAIFAAHPATAGAPLAPFDADEAAALRRRYDEDVAGLRAAGPAAGLRLTSPPGAVGRQRPIDPRGPAA